MKKLLLVLVCLTAPVFGQAVRVDPQSVMKVSGNGGAGSYPPLLAVPYAGIRICNAPANGSPCTNYAPTFSNASATVQCPTNAQITIGAATQCSTTTDAQGNYGFWLLPGNYAYTVTYSGTSYGPFPLSAGLTTSALGSGTPLTYLRFAPNTGSAIPSLQSVPLNTLTSTDYIFPVQSKTTTLSGSTPAAVTMAPCPLGVSGADQNHWLYVAGTGTPEPVLITGGTCASGALTGTIVFTPAGPHTAGWTIQTATGGVSEALATMTSAGGIVQLPVGSWNVFAHPVLKSNQHLVGQGINSSTLTVAAGAMAAAAQWLMPGYASHYTPIALTQGATSMSVENLSINLNGAANISIAGAAIGGVDVTKTNIIGVEVDNASNGVQSLVPFQILGNADTIKIDRNIVINQPGCAVDNTGPGGVLVTGNNVVVSRNYVTNLCGAAYVSGIASKNVVFDSNYGSVGNGVMSRANQMYSTDNGTKTTFSNNMCVGAGDGTGPACFTTATDDTSGFPSDNSTFIGNIAENCGDGILIAGIANQGLAVTIDNVISGNQIHGCIDGITIQSNSFNTVISNNSITFNTGSGIDISSTSSALSIKGLKIVGNIIDHNGTTGGATDAGIICQSSVGGIPCADSLQIQDNYITDSGSYNGVGVVQDYGIYFNAANTAPTLVTMSNNTVTNNAVGQIIFANTTSTFGSYFGPNTTMPGETYNNAFISPGYNSLLHGTISPTSGANQNVNIGQSGFIHITTAGGAFNIGGFTGGNANTDGRVLYLFNNSGAQLTINNNDAGSSVGNRIDTLTGSNVVLRASGLSMATFIYDSVISQWVLVASN